MSDASNLIAQAPAGDIPWDLPAPFVEPLTVDASHIDLMQHTNNVHYLQWVEDMAWAIPPPWAWASLSTPPSATAWSCASMS